MNHSSFAARSKTKHSRRRRVVPVGFDRRAPGSRAIDPIERAAAETVAHFVLDSLELRQMMAAHIVGSTVSYATIQSAVDAAQSGATITVDAGTYNESVSIYKPLTLLGNNAGVDGRGTRKAESVIFNSLTAITVGANNVTIDGFTIQGTKANVGARLAAGVYMKPNINGTDVVNNIILNNVTGVYLSNNSDTNACVIQRNYFYNNTETGADWTYGWDGSRAIYTDGGISGGLLTNVLIDSNKFYRDDAYVGEGAIALSALSANKQFNITITRNSFNSLNNYQSKALLAFNVTNLTFMGNDVTGTNDGSSGPVRFEGNAKNVNIQYNSIYNNAGPGVAADSSGAPGNSSGFVVNNNNITGNAMGLITIASQYDGGVVAVNDWWGSASGPSGDGPGTGQAVWANGNSGHYITPTGAPGGSIVFSPWATAAINTSTIPLPAAASGLTIGATSSSRLILNWTAPSSTATSQTIQRSTDGVNFTTVAVVAPLITTYLDSGLKAGTAYTYRIITSNMTGSAVPSNAAKVTLPAYLPPAPPAGLTISSATANAVTLSWSAPSNILSTVGYNVYRNGVFVSTTSGANTYTDTGLTPTTVYQYTVATLDDTGATSPQSAAVTALTAVTQINDGGFEATGITGYAYNPATINWTFAGSTGIATNGSAFGAATAPDGSQVAFIQSGTGASVSQSLTTGAGNFSLQFKIASRSGYGVNPINVTVDGKVIATVTPASSVFALYTTPTFALTAGTHTISFVSVNTTGDTTSFIDSVALNTFAVPPTPVNLAATAISASQITLRWQIPVGSTVASYTLQRSADGTNFTTVTSAIAGNSNSYTDTGLSAGQTYYYRLTAVNTIGASPASAAVSAVTLAAGSRSIALSTLAWTSATSGWSVPKGNTSVAGNTITIRGTAYAGGIGTHADSSIVYNLAGGYQVFGGVVGIDDEIAAAATPGVDFQVWGDGKLLFDSGGVGRSSAAVSFAVSVAGVKTLTLMATSTTPGNIDYCHADWAGVTLVANPAAPATPTNVVATPNATTPAGVAGVTVTWQADGTQTGSVVQRSDDGGKTYATVATVSGTAMTYTDTTVAAGKTYLYRVIATNAAGSSPVSAADDATTQKYVAPVAPTGLKSTAVTGSSVAVSWTAVAGVGGYVVYRNGTSVGTVTGAATTAFTDTTVAGLSSYQYTVASFDAFNATSPQSSPLAVTTPAAVTQAALTYNRIGITADGAKFSGGGFDGAGYAFSANLLGGSLTYNGVSFVLGAAGANDVVAAVNQTVALPQLKGTSLSILASAAFGPQVNQTFVVQYSDGTTQNVSLSVSDWGAPQNYAGETKVAATAYRNVSDGTQQAATFYVYGYSIALNSAKTVTGLTLPNAGNLNVFAIGVSTTAVAVPNAPSGLTASATSATQANLTWTATAGPAVTSYVLQRSTDGTNYADVATIAAAATAYADTGLTAGTTYSYRVLAVNAAGRSAASNVAAATPIATTATALSSLGWATATSGWQTVQKDANVKGTAITLRGTTYARGLGANTDSVITYNLTGLGYTTFTSDIGVDDAAGGRGTVDFQVVADGKIVFDSGTLTGTSAVVSVRVDVTGVKSLQLVASNTGDGIDYDQADWAGATLLAPANAAPAAPTGLAAAAAVDGKVRLAWTNVSPAATLRVQRSADGVNFATVADNLPAGTTSYADAAVQPGVKYTYRVIALNGTVASPPGTTAAVTTVSATAVVTNLSGLNWVSATSGWNTVQKNTSVAGKPLTLRGTTYATGIGTHADSQIVYDLSAGNYTRFQADVGIDDGVAAGAQVIFRVYGDGVLLFDSGTVTQSNAAVAVDLAIAGVKTLTLVAVSAVPGNIDYAHADWAGARLIA